MADFQKAFDHLIGEEGRKYTDKAADHGGPTKFGVTLGALAAWRGHVLTLPADVQNLTEDEAKQLYRETYWNHMLLDDVTSDLVGIVVFDQVVNRYFHFPTLDIQAFLGVTVDGLMGPHTVAAMNAADPVALCNAILATASRHYRKIVADDPTQQKFLRGWLNRLTSLAALLPSDKTAPPVA